MSDPTSAADNDRTVVYEPGAEEVPAITEPPVSGAFRYGLMIQRGPRAGFTYVLGEGPTVVGRVDDCDILLEDVTVSRHHARFVVAGDTLQVEDLRSTNGTYVNGKRRDTVALLPDDVVIVGKYHLVVVRGDI